MGQHMGTGAAAAGRAALDVGHHLAIGPLGGDRAAAAAAAEGAERFGGPLDPLARRHGQQKAPAVVLVQVYGAGGAWLHVEEHLVGQEEVYEVGR